MAYSSFFFKESSKGSLNQIKWVTLYSTVTLLNDDTSGRCMHVLQHWKKGGWGFMQMCSSSIALYINLSTASAWNQYPRHLICRHLTQEQIDKMLNFTNHHGIQIMIFVQHSFITWSHQMRVMELCVIWKILQPTVGCHMLWWSITNNKYKKG